MSTSKHLSTRHLKGLTKVGDVLVPGDGDMPSFSQTGCLVHMDRIADHLYADDRQGVGTLLTLFYLLPKPLIALLLALTERDHWFPGPLATGLRLVNLGIKGIVFTLYYSDLAEGNILDKLDWHTGVDTSCLDQMEDRDNQPRDGARKAMQV